MKAPIAQAAAKFALAPGCSFFFLGHQNSKCINTNSDFGWSRLSHPE
jgi:hypothetical protein